MAVWVAGFALLMLWRVVGHAGLALLSRRTLSITDASWRHDLTVIARHLGVRRTVRLVRSADVGAPVTWGHRHPVVLVPADALEWSADRRRAVLLHELAHVARNDYAVQFGAAIACAMYWFHPLVWVAARHLRNEAERACDDRALAAGIRGADYADHLLHLARNSRTLKLAGAVAIGMARRSTLEGRMLAALDTSVVRASLTRRARGAAAFAFGAALLPVAAVQPVLGSVVEVVSAVPSVTAEVPRSTPVSEAKDNAATVTTPVAQSSTARTARQARPVPAQDDTSIVRTFTVSRRGTLDIELGGGSITIEGWNENRVEVRAQITGANWRDIDVNITQRNNDVEVTTEYPRNTYSRANVSLTVRVPNEYDVQLQSGGGNVTISGVSGRFMGSVGGGNLQLRNLSGETNLATGGGTITITDSNLDGTVETGGGNITLTQVTGDLRPSTGGGRIMRDGGTLRSDESGQRQARAQEIDRRARADVVPTRARQVEVNDRGRRTSVYARSDESRSVSSDGTVHISKGSGAVEVDRAPNGASVSTGGGNIQIGEAGGAVRATTGGGTITVGPVAGAVTATTGGGDVSAVVVDAADAQVNITTGRGRVVIEIPRNFAGRVTLESGIPNQGDMPKFTTPWNLTEETIVQDSRYRDSPPSRNLRATGTVGNGRGLIRVTTGLGDIEIRYSR